MFALFSCFSAGEIIPRVWTRVRVRVEDRVRLRVRLRVSFRDGFQVADSGLCCLVRPCLFEVYLLRPGSLLCSRPVIAFFFGFIAVLCFNPFPSKGFHIDE